MINHELEAERLNRQIHEAKKENESLKAMLKAEHATAGRYEKEVISLVDAIRQTIKDFQGDVIISRLVAILDSYDRR